MIYILGTNIQFFVPQRLWQNAEGDLSKQAFESPERVVVDAECVCSLWHQLVLLNGQLSSNISKKPFLSLALACSLLFPILSKLIISCLGQGLNLIVYFSCCINDTNGTNASCSIYHALNDLEVYAFLRHHCKVLVHCPLVVPFTWLVPSGFLLHLLPAKYLWLPPSPGCWHVLVKAKWRAGFLHFGNCCLFFPIVLPFPWLQNSDAVVKLDVVSGSCAQLGSVSGDDALVFSFTCLPFSSFSSDTGKEGSWNCFTEVWWVGWNQTQMRRHQQ